MLRGWADQSILFNFYSKPLHTVKNLQNTGRIFFAIALLGIGLQAVYFNNLPYMLLPLQSQVAVVNYASGILFILGGAGLISEKIARPTSLLLGTVFLLIFCFYYVPYELFVSPNYKHLSDWENAEKELAFAGGAFAVARCFSVKNKNRIFGFLEKLIPLGTWLFAIPVISFGILHFLLAKEASTLVPAWIPYPAFWVYAGGVGLLGCGVAILLNIKRRLFAVLLGIIILIWFVSLHIPRVIAPTADRPDEITSAFLALAYSGIAFVIAGTAKNPVKK